MSNELSKEDKYNSRGFDGAPQSSLQKIMAKSVQLILSNFEGNDLETYLALDKKI